MPNPHKFWIAIGDIHDDADNLAKIPNLSEAAAIIITGDLTNYGNSEKAKKILSLIEQYGVPVMAQIGNMDLPEVNEWLEKNALNLHTHVRELTPDTAIFGLGGSNITPMHTPSEFTEEMYADWLEKLGAATRHFPHKILVSHCPPKDTKCDVIESGIHVGSRAVRKFIEEYQPEICLCGHIHEARGIDHIGNTIILNPGTLADGGYVIVRQDEDKITAELAQVDA